MRQKESEDKLQSTETCGVYRVVLRMFTTRVLLGLSWCYKPQSGTTSSMSRYTVNGSDILIRFTYNVEFVLKKIVRSYILFIVGWSGG